MLVERLNNLSRDSKRFVFFANDMAAVIVSLPLACALRYGSFQYDVAFAAAWPLFFAIALIAPLLILAFRLPQIKLMAIESNAIQRIGSVAACLALGAMAASFLLQVPAPRSVPLIFGALFFLAAVGTRLFALRFLNAFDKSGATREQVAIYGAGAAGIQLATALLRSSEMRPLFFVDDNPHLHGLVVAGLPVMSPEYLKSEMAKRGVSMTLLAMPSVRQEQRDALIEQLHNQDIRVRVLPSYVDMIGGKGHLSSLHPVSPDRLLGRDKVDLNTPEIANTYTGRVVMVTGAGGSIGSELCRQLVACSPKEIVLFEQGEFALYAIDAEMRKLVETTGIKITSRLGSVTHAARVAEIIAEAKVQIILHAAAYKHVPLVEANPLEGARNNVLGTQVVADAAAAARIERFILISTDKAVRPTSTMGATKRMAELVTQDRETRANKTKFAMVRFGNVLGSSGSVIPLFQKQIEQGGPVTVTHPDVTRFFMTIPEASRLVLLAGAYAEGGDVFVLDMGKPQRIIDIAHKMIKLSGRQPKDPETGKGEIAIEITGLRPGEKLYEELLIDDDSLCDTPHPKIMRANEMALSEIEVAAMLKELQGCISCGSAARLTALIKNSVDGYDPRGQESASA
ncbi:MAG: nucleoside-diphosphate sugar epimerase/dehydratase [Pseudomonadota bacterium]